MICFRLLWHVLLRVFSRAGEDREEDRRQNGDDRYDDK